MRARRGRRAGRGEAADPVAEGVDVVVTWVDGSDPAWQARRDARAGLCPAAPGRRRDGSSARFRDMGTLRLWFRGVERFAPWARRVHLVTCGQVPAWLDLDNPRLDVVFHERIMPRDALPTFNSNAIELCLDAIPGLTERFVYFNDDTFLVGDTRLEDYFRGALPRDMLACQPDVANVTNPVMPYIYLNNAMLLARHFDKRALMRRHPGWFFHAGYPARYLAYNAVERAFPQITGFYTTHGPAPLLRSTFSEVRAAEGEAVATTVGQPFRSSSDVSVYALREWQKLSGNFVPANVTRRLGYYSLASDADLDRLASDLRAGRRTVACVNDDACEDFPARAARVRSLLGALLPDPCSFERDGREDG